MAISRRFSESLPWACAEGIGALGHAPYLQHVPAVVESAGWWESLQPKANHAVPESFVPSTVPLGKGPVVAIFLPSATPPPYTLALTARSRHAKL